MESATKLSRVENIMRIVRRLTPSETDELARQLGVWRSEPAQLSPEAEAYWREQLASAGGLPFSDDDPFIGSLSVREYFALPEAEQTAIWDRLYAEELDR